ncbi:MAG: FG-GAP repeat protein, partial [Nanoarchaeota archaeon]|nr:FG-GAP repeat protein [Nanoarchaeota archaeon]
AYIFQWNGTAWHEQQKINANDAAINDYLGVSVSISSDGNTAIVGAEGKDSSAGAAYIFQSTTSPLLPTSTTFTSEETTNFSEVTLSSVTSLTLAIDNKGKIAFPSDHSINVEGADYDTNIVIEDEFISVNTAVLDSTFNSSATLTLEGVTCPVQTISYKEGAFISKEDIIAGGRNCELDEVCSNIQCNAGVLTFDVAHFTGFAAGADANLTTEAEAGVFYPLDPIEFRAEYVNSTDGTPISGECNITFDDDWGTEYTMDFDSTDYNYTKSFEAAGLHEYNVTCSSANFVTLEANDTKLVSSIDIPEFSVLTLGLGLMAVLIGLIIVRRKK